MSGIIGVSLNQKSGVVGRTPKGHVIQVVHERFEVSATAISVNSTTPTDGWGTSLSVNITPKQSNSKIHISFQGMNSHTHSYAGNKGICLFIYHEVAGGGFTNVTTGRLLSGYYENGSSNGEWSEHVQSLWYLHSPSYTVGQEIKYRVFYSTQSDNSAATYFTHSKFVNDSNHELDAIGIAMEFSA